MSSMCGIAGFTRVHNTAPSGSGESADALLDVLKHRGPDDYGWLTYAPASGVRSGHGACDVNGSDAVLLHRRLSILDLSEAGWQPMSSPDSRYHIVFNGEIYNYVELRTELQAKGHAFKSHSDTEVLLHAYMEWGAAALPRFVGMFAFAILDTQARKLFLARDFFGIKPLYYGRWNGGFAFASEIKPLLMMPGVSRAANPQRLYDFLNFGITDHGAETLLQAIHQLPAAHYLELPLNAVEAPKPVQYWRIDPDRRADMSFDEASKKLRELFLDSVRLHLRSDVPIGAALSGGIDSSAIVMAMRHLHGKKLDVHTFSFIAEHENLSEEKWVDIVAEASGATVHKVRPAPDDLMKDLEDLIRVQDEPFGSTSIYAQHRVFRLASEHGIKVMLDGQGADEMLGGYRGYLSARLGSLVGQGKLLEAYKFSRKASRLPGGEGLRMLLRAGGVWVPKSLRGAARRLIGQRLVPTWLNRGWFEERGVRLRPLTAGGARDVLRQQLQQSVAETSLPMLLRFEDRNSMAFSIESRVPFLTPALAEFILSLPEDYLISPDGTTKAVFRAAMRGIVPDVILDRKDKIGFATPEKTWLTNLQPWVDSTLQSDTARAMGAFNVSEAMQDWRLTLQGKRAFNFRFWRWINFIVWAERFKVTVE